MGIFHAEDRAAATSTTTGTGTLTVAAQPPFGYVTLANAGYAAGDTFDALIVAADGSGWEVSLCQLTSPTTVARLLVYKNHLGTQAFVNFNNSVKTITTDLPAAKLKVLYANAYTNGAYN